MQKLKLIGKGLTITCSRMTTTLYVKNENKQTYHSETVSCPCEHLQSSDVTWQEHVPAAPVDGTP